MTSSHGSRSESSRTSSSARAGRLRTPILILLLFVLPVIGFASGCGSRTVFVPEESPMRIGPSSSLRVYHRIDGVWTLSENRIAIPEGWYLVPPSYVRE